MKRTVCIVLILVLGLVVMPTAFAGTYDWTFVLRNPSSGITPDPKCKPPRTAGNSRANHWKIRLDTYSAVSQGDGVFFNCYETTNITNPNLRVKAGNGFYVRDTKVHSGSWKSGYYPRPINYSPIGRLALNEPSGTNVMTGVFNCQQNP